LGRLKRFAGMGLRSILIFLVAFLFDLAVYLPVSCGYLGRRRLLVILALASDDRHDVPLEAVSHARSGAVLGTWVPLKAS
jgi:hypothetical protein